MYAMTTNTLDCGSGPQRPASRLKARLESVHHIRDAMSQILINEYRFCDYKDKVIDLLARVTTVSVETLRITDAMAKAAR